MVESDIIHAKEHNPSASVAVLWTNSFSVNSRLISSLPDLLIDTAPTTVDGPVLSRHDRLQRRFVLHVSREGGQLRDDDDNLKQTTHCTTQMSAIWNTFGAAKAYYLELLAGLSGLDDTLDEGGGDLVDDGTIFLRVGDAVTDMQH